MKSEEEIAQRIRYRQRELAAQPPERRRALLTAEIRHLCDGTGLSEKGNLLEQLEQHFPVALSAIPNGPALAPEQPRYAPTLEEQVRSLREAIQQLPAGEQTSWKARVLQELGVEAAATPQPAGKLSSALQTFCQAMLLSPDPLLNDNVSSFSARDITNVLSLAAKLNQQSDPVSRHIWSKLSRPTQELTTKLALHRRAGSDLDQCAKALADDLRALVEGENLYDPERFARVTLSPESEYLKSANLNERGIIRRNQALLEDAFPEEIRCQTIEREVIDQALKRVQGTAEQPLTTQDALHLASVVLIQIGCLEQLARLVLRKFNNRVFDPVLGRLKLRWENFGDLLSPFLASRDSGLLAANVRDFSGLLKCLLFWYEFNPAATANALARLEPDTFERRNKAGFGGKTDYEKAFNDLKENYRQVRRDLCGRGVNETANEEELKDLIKKTIERKISALVVERYPRYTQDAPG